MAMTERFSIDAVLARVQAARAAETSDSGSPEGPVQRVTPVAGSKEVSVSAIASS